jgi:hypothetical protein
MMNMSTAQRKAMGAKGSEYVQTTFALSTVLERWEKLYGELRAKRKKA